jgi:hypothetical protein
MDFRERGMIARTSPTRPHVERGGSGSSSE